MLKLYNTYTKKKEEFKPINKGKALMYTCGPTVYDYAHIGNLRAYVFEDLLRRTLKLSGYTVTQVMNITDVDDKTIREAVNNNLSLDEYTEKYIEAFHKDLESLAVETAEEYPRATRHVDGMIAMIQTLIEKGHAYEQEGSVYYRVTSFPDYGKLSKKDLQENIAGARVDVDEYHKEDLCDFTLWKAKKEGEPFWVSPWGEGRPGWHIECSVMGMQYLGETFDIHTGGEDNIFPHHENEIAQSEAATGKKFVQYWLHCKFLLVDGEKMSKSKGNFYTLRDLMEKGYDALAIRYLLISHHYRHPVNFTLKGIEEAQGILQKIKDFWIRVEDCQTLDGKSVKLASFQSKENQFVDFLKDDLNISGALGCFFDLMHEVNTSMESQQFTEEEKKEVLKFKETFNQILGLEALIHKDEIPEEILKIASQRDEAKHNKNYERSDELRDLIISKGYALEDTKQGTRIKKV